MSARKTCSSCGEAKPADAAHFGADRRRRDGLDPRCRDCKRARQRRLRSTPEGREAARAATRQYRSTPEGREATRAASRESTANLRRRLKDAVNAIKLAAGCTDCGLTPDDPSALHFDHLPQFEKVDNVGDMVSRDALPWPVIAAEIANCEVVCEPCHRRRTRERKAVAA